MCSPCRCECQCYMYSTLDIWINRRYPNLLYSERHVLMTRHRGSLRRRVGRYAIISAVHTLVQSRRRHEREAGTTHGFHASDEILVTLIVARLLEAMVSNNIIEFCSVESSSIISRVGLHHGFVVVPFGRKLKPARLALHDQ